MFTLHFISIITTKTYFYLPLHDYPILLDSLEKVWSERGNLVVPDSSKDIYKTSGMNDDLVKEQLYWYKPLIRCNTVQCFAICVVFLGAPKG